MATNIGHFVPGSSVEEIVLPVLRAAGYGFRVEVVNRDVSAIVTDEGDPAAVTAALDALLTMFDVLSHDDAVGREGGITAAETARLREVVAGNVAGVMAGA